MIRKSLSALTIAATFMVSTISASAFAAEFCGQLIANSYHQTDRQLISLVLLKDLRDAKTKIPLITTGIRLGDKETAYKVAKVISQLTVQNSEQMKADLENSEFNWYYMYGNEMSPNPRTEDFVVCVDADLSKAKDGRLKEVNKLTDILEDGHSVIDLL